MNAARVAKVVRARRIVACALALSLVTGGMRSASAAGEDTSESRVGVVMAVVCGFALKLAIPAPVPWAGVAVAACTFAFLDAMGSP